MKITEIITEEQLDEVNWKKPLAALGTAAALAGGIGANYNTQQSAAPVQLIQPDEPSPEFQQPPSKQQQVQPPEAKQQNPLDLVAPATPEQIKKMLETSGGKYLYDFATKSGMRGAELAQFMGQSAHETQGFTRLRERGGSLDFKKYEPVFKKDSTGKTVDVNPRSKRLGNTQVGDGAKYIGRGFLHLTGRWNYTAASKALGLDLVKHPELLEKPEVAAKVALWFWQNRVQKRMAHNDFTDTPEVTKPINSGDAVEKRHSMFRGFDQHLSK